MRAISTRRSPWRRGFPWPVAARSRPGRSFTSRTCRPISARMKKPSSVAAYLRAVPPAPRAALQKLRKTIKAAAPEAIEVISYGIPMFKHHGMRSEEHTSELQSPCNLVCRLLLEKKKKHQTHQSTEHKTQPDAATVC